MNVLVVASHLDDEVLGCGGVIAKHVDEEDVVRVLFMCDREYGLCHDQGILRQEKVCARNAREILGYYPYDHFVDLPDGDLDITSIRKIIGPIEKLSEEFKPDIAYIPFHCDAHQDHRRVFEACMIALRPISKHKVKKILCYECPSTTDQNPWMNAFRPNVFVDIGKDNFHKKLEALQCYERECKGLTHPRSIEGVMKYAEFRGLQAHVLYAEAFVLVREIIE